MACDSGDEYYSHTESDRQVAKALFLRPRGDEVDIEKIVRAVLARTHGYTVEELDIVLTQTISGYIETGNTHYRELRAKLIDLGRAERRRADKDTSAAVERKLLEVARQDLNLTEQEVRKLADAPELNAVIAEVFSDPPGPAPA